jgi:hypothetical protein
MVRSSGRSGRAVVVTNAGAGLRRKVALVFAAKGYIIFGTAASPAEKRALRDASGGRVSLTVCDMTNALFVEAWAGGVADALGDAGLDILINDARIVTPGIDTARRPDHRQAFRYVGCDGGTAVREQCRYGRRRAHRRNRATAPRPCSCFRRIARVEMPKPTSRAIGGRATGLEHRRTGRRACPKPCRRGRRPPVANRP